MDSEMINTYAALYGEIENKDLPTVSFFKIKNEFFTIESSLITIATTNKQYEYLGNITIKIDSNFQVVNKNRLEEWMLLMSYQLPKIIQSDTGIEVLVKGGTKIEWIDLSRPDADFKQIPSSFKFLCDFLFFPVTSSYSNILIYEINKLFDFVTPYIDCCPPLTPEFIEEYEAKKQMFKLLNDA